MNARDKRNKSFEASLFGLKLSNDEPENEEEIKKIDDDKMKNIFNNAHGRRMNGTTNHNN